MLGTLTLDFGIGWDDYAHTQILTQVILNSARG